MEATFPGVKVYLSCREDSLYLLKNEERIITKEELKDNKHMFGYVRELTCDMQSNPVEEFMNESSIPCGPIRENQISANNDCVLLTNGIQPVASLNGNQIKAAIEYIRKNGSEPVINGKDKHYGWWIGVECDQMYEAASWGKRITLIPTGFGENLFKKMFPGIQILNLPS